MNRLFVLKDVAYATNKTGGTISSINEIDQLAQGALAVFTDRGTLIDITSSSAILTATNDVKVLQMVVGRAEDSQVIQVPKGLVNDITVASYKAAVKQTTTITISSSIENGEGGLLFQDNTFTSRYSTRRKDVSLIKKATQSVQDYVTAIVDSINESNWLEASSAVATGGFEITVEVKGETADDFRTIFNVAKDGILADAVIVSENFEYGQGLGSDVLQLEKDFSVEEGNGNYIEYGTEHYSRSFETVASLNYDIVNILWEGTHSSPTRSHNVMKNRLALASVNGAGDMNLTALQALLQGISNKEITETGQDTGEADGTVNAEV